jgi:hypothetical protein
MTKRSRKSAVRPIKTRRDFEGASALVKRMSSEKSQDSAAELRLQSLLKELDKFEEPEEEEGEESSGDYDYAGPRRRWSDDGPGSE